jgi:alanyl-tRNA synthetase
MEEHKQLSRRVRVLEELEARVEARELLAGEAHGVAGGTHGRANDGARLLTRDGARLLTSDGAQILARVFDGRDAESLKRLAQAVVAHTQTVALLGSRDGEHARLVFARSEDAAGDMSALMREACAELEGRGGGRPEMAQGGGRRVARLAEVIDSLVRRLS